jgi:exosome complex exonuclease RRP6
MDFVDRNLSEMRPVKPLPLEETPFKLVEEVKDLEDLAAALQSVEEFAVNFLPLIVFSPMCNVLLKCGTFW